MVKPIMKDIFFLGQKSEEATRTDLQVGKDLEDTLEANREGCVGMAANMIGVRKRVIIVNMGLADLVMFNPVLLNWKDKIALLLMLNESIDKETHRSRYSKS